MVIITRISSLYFMKIISVYKCILKYIFAVEIHLFEAVL